MGPDASLDLLKTLLTIAGGIGAAFLTGWLTRKSQKESSHIKLLTNLVDQLQEERDTAVASCKQVPLWRRYALHLRNQIYRLGGEPVDADPNLDL